MNNFIITIGRNAIENWNIIDKAHSSDMWFHLMDYPSSHVIIHSCDNTIIPPNLIYKAACLCKKHSKLNKVNNVQVIYTTIENVTKSTEIGSVTTKKTKIIKV
jgi:predicted ribosome quality control (RQC) complex YloA/Tae2 family protein